MIILKISRFQAGISCILAEFKTVFVKMLTFLKQESFHRNVEVWTAAAAAAIIMKNGPVIRQDHRLKRVEGYVTLWTMVKR